MREKGSNCKNKKIVFMGTPEISTYALNALLDKGYDVVAIVSQPDKPSGRKNKIIYSDVKKIALEKNISLFQPNKIKEIKQELINLKPYGYVTCAFGQFIPDEILEIPEFGCVNIHASLLPKYRGGAPIHWSIINGDNETGVCLMKSIKKMDAGDVYCYKKVEIEDNDTTSTLFKKMNKLVYDIAYYDLEKVFSQEYLPQKQDESLVSFAYNITKENEKINFNTSAKNIRNLIRGLSDKPGAYCLLDNKKIKLFNCELTNTKSISNPGTIVNISKQGLEISTTDFNILVKEIQFEGKNRNHVSQVVNGNTILKKELVLN